MKVKRGDNTITQLDSVTVELPGPQDTKLPELTRENPIEIETPPIQINSPSPIDNKTIVSEKLKCKIISYKQGDEDDLQEEFLNFFSETPKILYSTNWSIGIDTYFIFIYR